MSREYPRIERDRLIERLAEGHAARLTVLTPNRRLSRALQAAFDAGRSASGLAAWETADVLPFGAFLERLWEEALRSPLGASLPLLLTAAQQDALWEETLRTSRAGEALLAVAAAARECREAWALVHAWRLAIEAGRGPLNEDSEAFLEWSARYARATGENAQTDHARLPDRLAPLLAHGELRKPAELVMYGFDLVTPQQQDFLAAVVSAGTRVCFCEGRGQEGRTARMAFATPREELTAAASWARSRLEERPDARIGIVVPDLAQSRALARRILAAVLCPEAVLDAHAGRLLPFDLSLGPALSSYPLVQDALSILALAGRELPFPQASVLLRSPFLAGADSEIAERARLDAWLRERAGVAVKLEGLVRLAKNPRAPRAPLLVACLERLAAHRTQGLFAPRGAAGWARAVSEALKVAGFPGERGLDSVEHQTLAKWHETLASFASLDHVCGPMRYGEACARIGRLAAETAFQPESPEVPIQVLGALESAGLAFDHLWVSGLSDEAWPPSPRPNPFIPVRLQREAGIPQADPGAALELDRRITQGWLAAAPEVVVSHARMKGDSDLGPSPLIEAIPLLEAQALSLPRHATLRDTLFGQRSLERVPDARGPVLGADSHAGGTALFKDQAACPFRAFARHRLGAEPLEAPRPGLDARERGTLLHQVLASVWTTLRSKAALEALDDAALAALLEGAASGAIADMRRYRGAALSGRFADIEQARLVRATREWLEVERAREPFEVVAVENRAALAFGGLTVRAKLDRMDRFASGGHAVLDYKTGAALVAAWLGERPDEPQLPLYALAGAEDVRAVAFARVKPGAMEFCGTAREEGLLPKVVPIEKNRSRLAGLYADWNALLRGWRAELEALGRAFVEGDALVDPKHRDLTCAQCDRQMLCRVAEKMPLAFEVNAEEPEEEGA